jgi:hypothetical protein
LHELPVSRIAEVERERGGNPGWPIRSFHLQFTIILTTFIKDSKKSIFGIMYSGHIHL